MDKRFGLSFAAAITALALSAQAEVKLNALFADHAVLQRDRALPVWGTAAPGEAVTIELAGKTAKATADADGRWRAELPPLPAGGPFELVATGTNRVAATDVYVGEVWLASGQSNMEFTVSRKVKRWAGTLNEEAEIAAADHPMIRMFTVPLTTGDTPARDVPAGRSQAATTTAPAISESAWQVCSPETVPAFSAVGYFFARDLVASQKVPVGIVVAAYGASTAQAWISRAGFEADPALRPLLAEYDQAKSDFASGTAKAKADEALQKWTAATQQATPGTTQPRRPGTPKDPTKDQHSPTVCYNAMIAPVEAYAARGAIWYQGESNGIDNERYLRLMTALINDWRSRRADKFPFLSVQLAGYRAPATQPVVSKEIANVREAQRLTMMTLPDAAMATAFDIGHRTNVHPDNKQEVGRRLALAARATVYGEPVEWSGPNVEAAKLEGDAIRVTFTHADGLSVKPRDATTQPATQPAATTPQSFAVLSDGTWRWADATIDGASIVVKLNPGERPTGLRYAWADNPTTANVVNAAGLPMLPFRVEVK